MTKGKKLMTEEPTSEFAEAMGGLLTDDERTKAIEVVAEEPTADPLLVQILSTRRRHGSQGDTNFRLWLFNYIKSTLNLPATIEVEGNILVQTDPKSAVLFSCHVDTVHSNAESTGQPQQLAFDAAFGHLFLADKKTSGCLGGDDGCGVYIMLKMLKAGVKGKYIFHTGEECGGIGSNAFVKKRKKFCEELEMVIAFDRAVHNGDNPEVILTQGGQKCASTEFGEALCKELNKVNFELPYVVSHKGMFTDSKVYRNEVPECVNIGCFYQHQHGADEYVDVIGLEKLVKAACQVEWDKLPIIRNPFVAPPKNNMSDFDYYDRSYAGAWHGDTKPKGNGTLKMPPKPQLPTVPELDIADELGTYSLGDFTDFVVGDPDAAAQALVELTLRVKALKAELNGAKNMLGL